MIACQNSGQDSKDHFSGYFFAAPRKSNLKSDLGRPGENLELTRHACYLTAMNGDPRKPEIAAAQSYFAVKTREAEIAQAIVVQEEKSPADIFLESAIAFKDQEIRLKKLEQEQKETALQQQAIATQQQSQQTWLKGIDAELERLESSEGHYFSVIGFANFLGIKKIGKEKAKALGVVASAYCRQHNLRKEMIVDSMFGRIGNYPQEALRHAFAKDGLVKYPTAWRMGLRVSSAVATLGIPEGIRHSSR